MKNGASLSRRQSYRQSGSALLIILGCVALLTVLILSFFSLARTEFSTSNFYAKGVNTKLLSENVLNLVMAQLREGARSTDVNNTSKAVAWASQPGMIRTYGTDGYPYEYFKLYSWDNMVGSLGGGSTFDETAPNETAPTGANGWATLPNIYTDLNDPVNGIYPIIDPTAMGNVEGFSYTNAGQSTGSTNLLPMPVKWLYVMKDGTMSVGVQSGATTKVSIAGASVTNPVVGRVAFWTDDETCKVNINTASEGTFWDIPYGQSSEELGNPALGASTTYGYATSDPGQFEFQRIPGHPASTSLSTVFGYNGAPLADTSLSNVALTFPLSAGSYGNFFAPYYTLTPRYSPGGSMGGVLLGESVFNVPAYRLYDSVDELAFDPYRLNLNVSDANLYLPANGASPAGRGVLGITPAMIEQRRFFLTAHSRAPEETLFGTPRVSLWPLQTDTAARTAKDNLLAFCSSIGGEPYYYQRAQWYQYQKNGGTGAVQSATPSSQSTTADFPAAPTPPGATASKTGIDRNEDIYGYLQALTGKQIPGFGGDFFDKYPGGNNDDGTPVSDRDEILTEMFDLIRSGVNTFTDAYNVYPHYDATPFNAGGGSQTNGGSGSTVPIDLSTYNGTHGIGRTYNIAEVSLVFMASAIDLSSLPAGQLEIPYTTPYTTPYVTLSPTGNPTAIPPTYSHSASPRRISIGPGLPWACERDYTDPSLPSPGTQPGTLPYFTYWKTSGGGYQSYTIPDPSDPPGVQTAPLPSGGGMVAIGDPQTTAIRAFLLLRPVSVMPGMPAFAPNLRVRITNLDRMQVSFPLAIPGSTYSANLGFPSASNAVAVCSLPNIYSSTGESTPDGGLIGLNLPGSLDTQNNGTGLPTTQPPWNNKGDSLSNYSYPFVGQQVLVSGDGVHAAPCYPSPYGGIDPSFPLQYRTSDTNPGNMFEDFSLTPPPAPTVPIHLTAFHLSGGSWLYPGSTMVVNPQGTVTLKIEVLGGIDPNNPAAPNASTPVLSTTYVNMPTMTLPVPTLEMANGVLYAGTEGYACGQAFNNQGGTRIPGYGGSPDSTPPSLGTSTYSTVESNATTFTRTVLPIDYYTQLPETLQRPGNPTIQTNPMNIISRFSSSGSIINRGDVVRSFTVNPNSSVGGDERLLAANPIRGTNTAVGDPFNNPGGDVDIMTPMGSQRALDNTYKYLRTQGPWTSPWIKQLHSLITNFGDGRTSFALVQTSAEILTGIQDPTVSTSPVSVGFPVSIGLPSMNSAGPGMFESSGALFSDSSLTGNSATLGAADGLEHYPPAASPTVTGELEGAYMDVGKNHIPGDWTVSPGTGGDGPFVLKPDEGIQSNNSTYYIPYYQSNMGNLDLGAGQSIISFAPNRQVPSGIIFGTLPSRVFGSLPSGSQKGVPWCTLLFCPNPASNDSQYNVTHPGFGLGSATAGPMDYPPYSTPPDHLLLDNFWMPVVEPYAISEPFSTAGKVNMNYAMVPFGEYIERSTALHAVMKSTRVMAVPTIFNDGINGYGVTLPTATAPSGRGNNPAVKSPFGNIMGSYGSGYDFSVRYGINLNLTIDDVNSQFYQRFHTYKDLFRCASEICNVFLVPQKVPHTTGTAVYYGEGGASNVKGALPPLPSDASYASMTAWWKNFKLTGDNGRESPYNQIYPRLTTKSDSYQVHMRVQVLAQTRADVAAGTFDSAGGDSVVGEYRGSAIIERYVDPNQAGLPDFATAFPSDATKTLDSYVRYRVLSVRAFSP